MQAEINLKTTVIRRNELPSTDLDGEVGLMNMDTGKYFGFDAVGTRIWELLEGKIQVNALVSALFEEYEVERATCEEQVLAFLNRLMKEGLIQIEI